MGEVAARVVHGLIETAESTGIDTAPILRGMPFTRSDLRDWMRRVRWDDYMELFDRLEATAGREALFEMARRYHDQYPELRALAGGLISPRRFARLYLSMAASATPHLETSIQFVSDFEVHYRMAVPAQYREAKMYFETSVVALEALTCYLGMPRTRVDGVVTPRTALFVIHLPPSETLGTRVPRVARDLAVRALQAIASLDGDLVVRSTVRDESVTVPSAEHPDRLRIASGRWSLTGRETEVLGLLVNGKSSKEIAIELACSPRTIEIHAAHLLEKSRQRSRAELIAAFWTLR